MVLGRGLRADTPLRGVLDKKSLGRDISSEEDHFGGYPAMYLARVVPRDVGCLADG